MGETTHRPRPQTEEKQIQDYQTGRKLVSEAQKRILKSKDYADYLQYLRNWRPRDYNTLIQELRKTDKQAYAKLMQYAQFRPKGDVALGGKAAEKSISAAIGLISGNYSGTMEKWLETSVKESMERNGWSPKVLGSRASTLPARPSSTYSTSRLGQYLKVEDARAAKAASKSQGFFQSSVASIRSGFGTATTRVMGPLVDLGMNMLNPQTAKSTASILGYTQAEKLYAKGVLDEEQWETALRLNSQGKIAELDRFLREAKAAYVRGGGAE